MSQIRKIKDMKTAKKGSTGNVTPLKKVTLVEKEEVINVLFYFLDVRCVGVYENIFSSVVEVRK